MPRTPRIGALTGTQITDGTIEINDLCDDVKNKSVIKKVAAGSGIKLNSTGIDNGTGVVTINTSTFIHNQDVPTDSCLIYHNLNKFPSVIVIDSAGTKVEPDIKYINDDSVLISSTAPFAFKAYLN